MKDWKVKERLLAIRETKRRVELILRRLEVDDTDEAQKELAAALQELKRVTVRGMDIIAHLENTDQQMVMTRRYVDLESWEEIAAGMATTVRAVQKLHGRALPLLEEILKGPVKIA